MDEGQVSGKQVVRLLIIGCLVILVIGFFLLRQSSDGKLHLIFCDVGQGDAILIKTPTGNDFLVDSGPDNSVVSCLGRHLSFYDRTLELALLTHPQSDHLAGFIPVLKNYTVQKFIKTKAINTSAEFKVFERELINEKSQEVEAIAGKKINLDLPVKDLTAKMIWPVQSVRTMIVNDLNLTSIVLRVDYGNFCALLTGDATLEVWFQLESTGSLKSCFLLKVAHHGSKNATDAKFLDLVNPKIAVISAGRHNRYGHPHKEVLDALSHKGTKIFRTDELGTIEVVTDGKSVTINSHD